MTLGRYRPPGVAATVHANKVNQEQNMLFAARRSLQMAKDAGDEGWQANAQLRITRHESNLKALRGEK